MSMAATLRQYIFAIFLEEKSREQNNELSMKVSGSSIERSPRETCALIALSLFFSRKIMTLENRSSIVYPWCTHGTS